MPRIASGVIGAAAEATPGDAPPAVGLRGHCRRTRPEDSSSSHADDTMKAGAGLCDGDAVRFWWMPRPLVDRLQQLGMAFDRDNHGLATTLEAAHSHRRVLHVQDRTGRALVDVLRERVEQRPGLLHRRGVRVTRQVEDGRCCGVQLLDGHHLQRIQA